VSCDLLKGCRDFDTSVDKCRTATAGKPMLLGTGIRREGQGLSPGITINVESYDNRESIPRTARFNVCGVERIQATTTEALSPDFGTG
jgi:hypothetical protein